MEKRIDKRFGFSWEKSLRGFPTPPLRIRKLGWRVSGAFWMGWHLGFGGWEGGGMIVDLQIGEKFLYN